MRSASASPPLKLRRSKIITCSIVDLNLRNDLNFEPDEFGSKIELETIIPTKEDQQKPRLRGTNSSYEGSVAPPGHPQLLDPQSLDHKITFESKANLLEEEETSPWGSLWIANVILLAGSIQFSIFFSSLWPYLKEMDSTAKEDYIGWLIAGFSIGQFVASPIFGFWSNKIRQARLPVVAGIVCIICSNFVYVFVETFPSKYAFLGLLVARVISGIGAGNASVLRAYIATASTAKDRPKAIALGTAAFTLGYILGPGLQAVFSFIGTTGYVKGAFHLDVYTAPAYAANVANLLLLIMIYLKFHERYAGLTSTEANKDPFFVLPPFDKLAVGILIWAWFTLLLMGVNIETIASPYTMAMFDWSKLDAVTYNGIILSVSAVVSFIVYLAYAAKLSTKIDDRKSIIFGIATIALYYFITWPWPGLPGKLNFYAASTNEPVALQMTSSNPITGNATYPKSNDSLFAALPLSSTGSYANLSTTALPVAEWRQVGCNPKYKWCYYTPPVPLWMFLGFWPLLSIGYPAATVAISVLFAKVLGPRRQGTMQGVMMAAGSLSRTVGPLSISYLFELSGPRAAWALCSLAGLVTLLPYPFVYKRLVPLQTALNQQQGSGASHANHSPKRNRF